MAVSTASFRSAQFKNNESFNAFVYDSRSKVYKASPSGSSVDPFASKTNKYAESGLVELISDAAMHFHFGSATLASATTSNYFLPANTRLYVSIDEASKYMRAIGTGNLYVTELF